jgi:hypothetical protein
LAVAAASGRLLEKLGHDLGLIVLWVVTGVVHQMKRRGREELSYLCGRGGVR